MGVSGRIYTYTDCGGQKVGVPMEQVNEVSQLRKGDHIFFEDWVVYEHHAIVEYIDEEKGTIHVIEYINTAEEFLKDNCCKPKNKGKAEVRKSKYTLGSEKLFLIKHKKCFDADTVVLNALSKLGERKYNLITNNCEHLALWCKTGISSSEQVNNLADNFKKGISKQVCDVTKNVVTQPVAKQWGQEVLKTRVQTAAYQAITQTVTKGRQEVLRTGVHTAAKQAITQTVTKGGQEVFRTGVHTAAKQAITQTVTKGGQEVFRTGVHTAAKQGITQTVTKGGQEVFRTGVHTAAKQAITQTVTKGGQEVFRTGVHTAAKQGITQTVTKGGQEVFRTGVHTAAKQGITQTVTKGGQEVFRTGVHTAAKQAITQTVTEGGQEVLKTGVSEAAKQVTTQTVCNSGQTVVKTGVLKVSKEVVSQSVSRGGKETTREVITQTSKSNGAAVGESALGGAVFAVAFEGAFAAYDIHCANKDRKSGKISEAEYKDTVGKRICSSAGAIAGQALIPIPLVGGVIGSVAGGLVGKLYGHRLWNSI